MKEVFAPLENKKARIDLTMNSSKTKYMIAGRARSRSSGVSVEVVIDTDLFEIVFLCTRLNVIVL